MGVMRLKLERPSVDLKQAEKNRPKPGTPFGDEVVGTCAHPLCCRRVRRHEAFIVTLAGDLFCSPCWAMVECEDLSKKRPDAVTNNTPQR